MVLMWVTWVLTCCVFKLSLWFLSVAFGYLFFALLATSWRWLRIKCAFRIKPSRSRAILVTGATSGIGLSVAKHFHRLGFTIIGAYYNDQEPGYEELRNLPQESMLLVRMDVTSADSIAQASRLINDWLDERPGVELFALVNNAGSARAGPFEWASRHSISSVLDTNVKGLMLITRQFIYKLSKSQGSRVINVSSSLSYLPWPGAAVYGATKNAVNSFTEVLGMDLEPYGIKCCAVLPGNLTASSNIIYTRIACLQQSIKELSEEEKIAYGKSIEGYTKQNHTILRGRLQRCGDDPHHVASVFKFDLPPEMEHIKAKKPEGKSRKEKSLVNEILNKIDGRAIGLDEEPCVMGAFEDVLLIKSQPPWRTYAGNALFSHIVGPMLEHMTSPMIQMARWIPKRNLRHASHAKSS